jgi:spore coat protein A
MDFTGPQVYRGLAGFFVVGDDEEDALPLPAGEKAVSLLLADRAFREDGSFFYPSRDPSLQGQPGVEDEFRDGVLGDVILVNGAPWPFLEVVATRYRFRILNASNARRYALELDPAPPEGSSFVQVGSDGGLLASPVSHRRLPISPAERFDVVIDFSQYAVGDQITLMNRFGDGPTAQVMQFRVVRNERDDT